jgi:hypothetical protein
MKRIGSISVCFLLMLLLGASFHEAYAQSSRGLAIPRERLPKTVAELSPKDFFVPSTQKKVGVVHALEGSLVIVHGKTKEAYFGAAGDEIYENDSLTTLADSRCRIRFVDEDVVTMAPETEFGVESFEDQRSEGKKSSFFRMVKGKAMFYAMRLFRYRETRLTLATPTATIGVRGTKFGTHVYYEDGKVAGRGILVADRNNEIAPYLAQAPGGGRIITDSFSEDGVLNVNGQAVPPGQMFSGRTGQVIPTPPSVIQSFRQETQLRGEGGTSRGTGGTEGGETGPAASLANQGGAPVLLADIQENVTSITQTQQTTKTADQAANASTAPRDVGYFAAMLTHYNSPNWLGGVYFQYDDNKHYETDTVRGKNIMPGSAYYIEGRPNFGGDAYLTRIYTSAGDSGDLGTTRPISHTSLGSSSYMDWGYWTMPTLTTVGSYQYYINNKAYYIVGQVTENIDRLKNLGDVTYSGSAWGTYFSAASGIDMTGSFSTKANLNSGALTDFNISVSGGGKSASITGASGTLNGSNPAGNNFEINTGSGSWSLNGSTPSYKAARGALYGPNAEQIGGAWGMYSDSNNGAVGIFKGTR